MSDQGFRDLVRMVIPSEELDFENITGIPCNQYTSNHPFGTRNSFRLIDEGFRESFRLIDEGFREHTNARAIS